MKDASRIIEEYLGKGHDFGFTGVDEAPFVAEIKTTQLSLDGVQSRLAEREERLKRVEALIMPLISNLIKTADTEFIKWPNRERPLRDLAENILAPTRFE